MNLGVILLMITMLLGFGVCMAQNVPLKVDDRVPNFVALDDRGKNWSSADHADNLVLYFYPSDDTPGCTAQACSLNSWQHEFKKRGIEVVGVSYNSVESHKNFKQKHRLTFTLLSDPQAKIAKLFGADRWWPNLMPKRKTIIIKKGVVRNIIDDVEPASHAQRILQDIH